MNTNKQDFYNQTVLNPSRSGLSIEMINDQERNRLYDKLIKNNVYNKTCTDIGFGSGILTLMCLHHGASHVTAYEPNKTTFDFGSEIIDSFGLSHKVTLINEYYDGKTNSDVVVWEPFDNRVWGEGLLSILDKIPNDPLILPNEVTMTLVATDKSLASFDKFSPKIDTGVDYLNDFSKLWVNLRASKNYFTIPDTHLCARVNDFTKTLKTFNARFSKPVDKVISTDFVVDKPCFIACFFNFDDFNIADGHWDIDKAIYVRYPGEYKFTQRTSDGQWWLEKK